ncbi:uncharacterized protein LOC107370503 [Tetranychus urticae]|uniref:uncharacterized protein LOC107370503 n=1 Tax=Tetranychus urticae TaxID=32264 RepID=UPI000D6557ED|nr:uncharacterized protein LOC107370503 [Tetranychus urticae]
MKNTIRLILLFAVINVSYSESTMMPSLRELDFIKSLYPREDVPDMLLTSLVNRRIDQVKTLYEKFSSYKDSKDFYNNTEQSLQLLLESNRTSNADFYKAYERIVDRIVDVNYIMGIDDNEHMTINTLFEDTESYDLQAILLSAYIDDIEMVCKCEDSLGNSYRVDMKIVDRLKSLSSQFQNYRSHNTNGFTIKASRVSQSTIYLCLWQFRLLLKQFTATFTHYLI